jgi:hypothetical protein
MNRIKNRIKFIAVSAVAGLCFIATAPQSQAQVSVSIGAEPTCPYGYYDYAPYNCSPSGYYGPEWYSGTAFIGAGPWFHGSSNFHGNVNNTYDPQHGYSGATPSRGDARAATGTGGQAPNEFKGNEVRDGRGNVGKAKP